MLLGACVLICVWAIPSVLACEKVHGTVVVKTADHYNAGTDDTIQMMILMDNDQSPWHNLESDPEGWRNDLETGATDTFVLKVCPEGRINGFILKHTGTNDWWFPEWVKITYPEQNPCIDCQLNQWLTLDRYIACLMDNFPMWNKRLHDEGYFDTNKDRYLVGFRAAYNHAWIRHDWNKDGCYYWTWLPKYAIIAEGSGRKICEETNAEVGLLHQ